MQPGSGWFHALLYGPASTHTRNNAAGDTKLKDIATVKGAFTDHFSHLPNEQYKDACFHCRGQQLGETAEAFYTAFWSIVKCCNYVSQEVEQRL